MRSQADRPRGAAQHRLSPCQDLRFPEVARRSRTTHLARAWKCVGQTESEGLVEDRRGPRFLNVVADGPGRVDCPKADIEACCSISLPKTDVRPSHPHECVV